MIVKFNLEKIKQYVIITDTIKDITIKKHTDYFTFVDNIPYRYDFYIGGRNLNMITPLLIYNAGFTAKYLNHLV